MPQSHEAPASLRAPYGLKSRNSCGPAQHAVRDNYVRTSTGHGPVPVADPGGGRIRRGPPPPFSGRFFFFLLFSADLLF